MFATEKGQYYEQKAYEWLLASGLEPVARNYRCRFGEIDLIMRERETLCFIEVKYRSGGAFGGTAYSLPLQKQQKITRTALDFLNHNPRFQRDALRFDALFVQANGAGREPHIEWIKSAFDAD